ncbi:Retrovirus-related Pol polyprotein, partial [Mucuna pruriens]
MVPVKIQNSWRVCIDYRKLNQATRKDHFPLSFIDKVLEKLVGYIQIYIALVDQHKTTFTCSFRTFAYTRMSFSLCNALSTFQRCMINIFSDLLEECMKIFMDDFIVSFWDLVSARGVEVDKAKIDVISSLSNPTFVQKVCSFLGHASFYRRFIKNFNKIALPLSKLLQKDVDFIFDKPCMDAFQELKRRITTTPILQAPNWELPFELMCDASNSMLGAVLG